MMAFIKMIFIQRGLPFLLLGCACLVQSLSAQTYQLDFRITSSNNVSTIYWMGGASYLLVLQTTTDLSPAATWTNLATDQQFVSLNSFPATGGYAVYTTNQVLHHLTTNTLTYEAAFGLPVTNQQQFFRLSPPRPIPACCFAVFYNGLLEFSQCPTMVLNGRVHAEGPVYVGTTALLTFNAPVTMTSTLSAPLVDGLSPNWTPSDPGTWNATFNGGPGYITNTSSIGIPGLSRTNYHFLIEVPPASEPPLSPTGQLRLFNQAQMILLVTNDINGATNPMVSLQIQAGIHGAVPANDPLPAILYYTNASPGLLRSNLSFLSLTNTTFDQREGKTNIFTQLDIGKFANWIATNLTVQAKLPAVNNQYPTILYVADRRNVNVKQLASVRLVNGAQLPANNNLGFTVATMNPLYILANYNTQTASSAANASASTANTTYTVPAALMSDSLTILSPNWSDDQGYAAYDNSQSKFDAADMTINAAIITGSVASTGNSGTNFSGGIHNLSRLLEDWSAKNLWLNTSFIRLWDSNLATNQFRNPQGFNPIPVNPYYNPPTRHYSFDLNYLDPAKIPPGMPSLYLGY